MPIHDNDSRKCSSHHILVTIGQLLRHLSHLCIAIMLMSWPTPPLLQILEPL